jgi:hypothetical protein
VGVVRATPNEYLLVGRGGRLENRGSAVQTYLRPGTVWVRVPSTKQEAIFEFTQETRDGIPLRFKGIIVYRITDPVATVRQFDFAAGRGTAEITDLLIHVSLGELRDAVSHMTMAECIEGRKTTLSQVAEAALAATIGDDGAGGGWGISIEVAQLAQVFIVDADLRRQLEAEVRNEIKLRSDRSDLETTEAVQIAEMERGRRLDAETLVSARHTLDLQRERLHAEMEAEADRATTEAPVRLLRIEREIEVARRELELRRIQIQVRALEVEHELMLSRGQQELRREILPIEQAPLIVKAASKVLNGANLSVYGEEAQLVGQLGPILDVLGRAVVRATTASG